MMGVEAEWDKDQGKYKLYTRYGKEIAGDDIGTYFSFHLRSNLINESFHFAAIQFDSLFTKNLCDFVTGDVYKRQALYREQH